MKHERKVENTYKYTYYILCTFSSVAKLAFQLTQAIYMSISPLPQLSRDDKFLATKLCSFIVMGLTTVEEGKPTDPEQSPIPKAHLCACVPVSYQTGMEWKGQCLPLEKSLFPSQIHSFKPINIFLRSSICH